MKSRYEAYPDLPSAIAPVSSGYAISKLLLQSARLTLPTAGRLGVCSNLSKKISFLNLLPKQILPFIQLKVFMKSEKNILATTEHFQHILCINQRIIII